MNVQSRSNVPVPIERLAALALVLAAALLRAAYLLQIEHNIDRAYPVAQALHMLDRGEFALTGQATSVLFANPPLTAYLYLPFVALARTPLAAYLPVIALNTLAVLLAYRAARCVLGGRWALLAAGLMAFNPWVIEYSRSTWVQSLLPFGMCALAWLLWPVLLKQSSRPARRTLAALIVLALLAQTYLLAYALVIPVGLLLLVYRRSVPRRAVLIGAAVVVLASLPYAIGLVSQWDAVQARLSRFGAGEMRLRPEAWDHAVRLISGHDYALARGVDAPAGDAPLRQTLGQGWHGIVTAALLIGLVAAGREVPVQRRSGGESRPGPLLLIWFGAPVLLMIYAAQVIHPFYLLLGLPAGYVLAAWGVRTAVRLLLPGTLRGRIRPIAWAAGALLLIGPAALLAADSVRYAQESAALPGAHGLSALPLEDGLRLGRAIREALPPGGVVFADVDEATLSSLAGQALTLVRDARLPPQQPAVQIVPASGGVYVIAHPPRTDLTVPPAAQRHETLALPDGWTITVDAVASGAGQALLSASPDVPSQQGIALRGYALSGAGRDWVLDTVWQVESVAAETGGWLFAPFAHVFDASGTRVLVVDGAAVPGYEWVAGGVHLHRMAFRLPQGARGPFTLAVGQYDAVRGQNAIFTPPGEFTPLLPLPEVLAP